MGNFLYVVSEYIKVLIFILEPVNDNSSWSERKKRYLQNTYEDINNFFQLKSSANEIALVTSEGE